MKTISIVSQQLRNWKAAFNQDVTFGKRTKIHWANEKGKSTIKEAFEYLITGKHPKGKTDIDIKTKYNRITRGNYPAQEMNSTIHHLNHVACAVLDIDGEQVSLQKNYHETWEESLKTMTGHTTEHEFDGHKLAEGKFKKMVSDIVDERIFRILTDPLYFCQTLPWKESREILISMCPGIEQSTVDGYESVKDLIKSWSAEEKKIDIKSEIKKTKGAKAKIGPAIAENVSHFIKIAPDKRVIADMEAEKEVIRKKIERIESGSGNQVIEREIALVEAEMIKRTNEFNSKKNKRQEGLDLELRTKTLGVSVVESSISKLVERGNRLRQDLEKNDNSREVLVSSWKNKKTELASMINLQLDDVRICTKCGQSIPDDQIQENRSEFNLGKSKKIEEIQNDIDAIGSQGSELKEKADRLRSTLSDIEKLIENDKKNLTAKQGERDVLNLAIDKLIKETVNLDDLESKKADLKSKIGKPADTSEYTSRIRLIDSEIKEVNQRILHIKENEKYSKRIAELEKDDERLSMRIAELENQLNLLDHFIVAEVTEHSRTINEMFEVANFKMFEMQVNGNINNNMCECAVDGVPFNCLNSAAKTQVGIDIIKTLQQFYGVKLPIFVDNRESVTDIPDIDCQVISLFVSPEDTKMRIEYDK